jgi:hypothetical protein
MCQINLLALVLLIHNWASKEAEVQALPLSLSAIYFIGKSHQQPFAFMHAFLKEILVT